MCCLFGLLDYNKRFSFKDKNSILSVLSTECEARGTDATGIAYNVDGRLCIYKRALPAHRLSYDVPNAVSYIMGHTRLTTQGTEKRNFNNHPFLSTSGEFALAHNGILYNDYILRNDRKLPQTKIKTDSYIAVQLIEQQKTLNFNSLKHMAEKVEGSFVFTVIDRQDNLYVVRGDNPFCLYHYPHHGFYLYASTEEILTRAIKRLGLHKLKSDNIPISYGDMLKIDRHGKIKRDKFEAFDYSWLGYRECTSYRTPHSFKTHRDDTYLQDLITVAFYNGYSPDDIQCLLDAGHTYEEIEKMICIPYLEHD
jgi:glucosamine 6-phosphate synthetase-like amidotransferase/phosphosugar isomerase protein